MGKHTNCKIMNAALRLKLCNRTPGIILLLMLISGIQLEATSGIYAWSVWVNDDTFDSAMLPLNYLCIAVAPHLRPFGSVT